MISLKQKDMSRLETCAYDPALGLTLLQSCIASQAENQVRIFQVLADYFLADPDSAKIGMFNQNPGEIVALRNICRQLRANLADLVPQPLSVTEAFAVLQTVNAVWGNLTEFDNLEEIGANLLRPIS